MSHLIENPAGRCTEPNHVNDDSPCTWLSVSDVNQATDITLEGTDVRELGLALGKHFADLQRAGLEDRAESVRTLARSIGVLHLQDLMLP